MSKLVENKVVVVTGSGGGIGRDIALAMAREGAKLVINDIGASVSGEGNDAGPAAAVVAQIKEHGRVERGLPLALVAFPYVALGLSGFEHGYSEGSFLWIVNKTYFQYFSVLITIVSALSFAGFLRATAWKWWATFALLVGLAGIGFYYWPA